MAITGRIAWLGMVALVATGLAACEVPSPSSPPPSPRPTSTSPEPVVAPGTAPPGTTSPTQSPGDAGDTVVLVLTVSEIPEKLPKYDRKDWRHWRDADGDCQDARQETLVAQSVTPVVFETADECRVESGSWVGPYTGNQVDDPGVLDIDHMVPLANAHRSGGWQWSKERKAEYANSLDYAGHLLAATRSANRAKGADGPEDWRPPYEGYWCDYAIDWVTIKSEWGLTATMREAEALREMLDRCPQEILLRTE